MYDVRKDPKFAELARNLPEGTRWTAALTMVQLESDDRVLKKMSWTQMNDGRWTHPDTPIQVVLQGGRMSRPVVEGIEQARMIDLFLKFEASIIKKLDTLPLAAPLSTQLMELLGKVRTALKNKMRLTGKDAVNAFVAVMQGAGFTGDWPSLRALIRKYRLRTDFMGKIQMVEAADKPEFQVKYSKTKRGSIKVAKFTTLGQAKTFLKKQKDMGYNGIISKNGKPVTEAKLSFDQWMKTVDALIAAKIGVGAGDLADMPYRDWFDSRMNPRSAAARAIKLEMSEGLDCLLGEKKKEKNNAFAICTDSVGRDDKEKYERCVKQVKAKTAKKESRFESIYVERAGQRGFTFDEPGRVDRSLIPLERASIKIVDILKKWGQGIKNAPRRVRSEIAKLAGEIEDRREFTKIRRLLAKMGIAEPMMFTASQKTPGIWLMEKKHYHVSGWHFFEIKIKLPDGEKAVWQRFAPDDNSAMAWAQSAVRKDGGKGSKVLGVKRISQGSTDPEAGLVTEGRQRGTVSGNAGQIRAMFKRGYLQRKPGAKKGLKYAKQSFKKRVGGETNPEWTARRKQQKRTAERKRRKGIKSGTHVPKRRPKG